MSINSIADETAFTIDRRGIYHAIIASFCVHLAALHFLSQLPAPHKAPATQKVSSSVRVQLTVPRKPPARTAETQYLSEIPVLSRRRTVASPKSAKMSKVPEKLLIAQESLEAAIRNTNEADSDWNGLSDNGAIVFSRELLAKLNQSERHLGIMADGHLPDTDSSFSGGSWTDYIRIGNTCFRVIQANPQEPISRETWYRIKCSR